jgi:hypothetical protein
VEYLAVDGKEGRAELTFALQVDAAAKARVRVARIR